MKDLVMILGKSACGKSSVADMIDKYLRYDKLVLCTTRPKRAKEFNGIDYYFIDDSEFKAKIIKDDFIYYSQYDTPDGSWYYGLEKAELDRHVYGVLVIEPDGARAIKERLGEFTKCKTIYIDSDDKERYIRQINRGDEIMEISLRAIRDNVAFMGIEREIDYTVTGNTVSDIYREILKILL